MIFKVASSFILFTFACGLAANHKYANENENQNYYSGAGKQYHESQSNSHNVQEEKYEDAYPQYEFKYAVNDDHSGDSKSQHEIRDGDKVRGVYSLTDTDGFQRIVEYTADDKDGFVAVVRREPIEGYKAPQQKYANHQQQYESYAAKPQTVRNSQSNTQQQYESYTVQPKPSQQNHANREQDYESYSVKAQPERQYYEYKPVQTQKYVQPSPQAGSGYDKSQEGKYVIKYSTSAPAIVTAAPEHKYQYVAPVTERNYVAPSVAKTNQNQKTAISHVNNYFETPLDDDHNSASEYSNGYEY